MDDKIKNDQIKDIDKSKFVLVQQDKKIHDTKFDTKPTTFAKDALKRFSKNKSSVAGAIVLGFLILLAIFVPIFSPFEIKTPRTSERLLAPKLFNAGTGFWDGTRKMNNIVYDTKNEVPAGFYKPAVSNLVVDKVPTYINSTNDSAIGGYFMFINEITTDINNPNNVKFLRSTETEFTSQGNYQVALEFLNENDVLDSKLGEYRVYISYEENGIKKQVILQDWSTNYAPTTINISEKLAAAGITKLEKARLSFDLKPQDGVQSFIGIKKAEITANENVSNHDVLPLISIVDANQSAAYQKDATTQQFPIGYWQSSGVKGVYKAEIYYCSFIYDTYAAVYDTTVSNVALSTIKDYVANGYCEYNEYIGPDSFKKLTDDCPIEDVISEQKDEFGLVSTVEVKVARYKQYGYTSMPKFIFGTDNQGHDAFTKAFAGLRTSLILGLCTGLFSIVFGLIWGSISGYFGGNVDIVMERFCDILGGIPWIVIITLCILHMGNNFLTFVIALCLTSWIGVAARTRTQFYRFKGREYILASRTLGASDKRLIFKHILPNAMGTIITSSVLIIPSVIFNEATLAYLNLGLQGLTSFGVMLSENQKYLSTYPNLIVFPAVVMALIMISFNLFGNGLRDALNPSLKGSE